MKVKIINKSDYKLPQYQTDGAVALDLVANTKEPITLKSLERAIVPTGIHVQVPEGYSLQISPRSGLAAKHGISVVNSPGLIDQDYSGDIGVILVNLSSDPFTFQPGERIAQMSFIKIAKVEWVEADKLDASKRGDQAYGSTGIA